MESRTGSKGKTKYYVLIVLFTVIFFICMAFCFIRFGNLAHNRKINSLSYRMDSIKNEEKLFGVEGEFYDLYFSYNYEEEFDERWAFADAYLAYVRGKFADDKTPYIEKVKAYLDTKPGGQWEETARQYLEALERR